MFSIDLGLLIIKIGKKEKNFNYNITTLDFSLNQAFLTLYKRILILTREKDK